MSARYSDVERSKNAFGSVFKMAATFASVVTVGLLSPRDAHDREAKIAALEPAASDIATLVTAAKVLIQLG